jgi:hypothetical protein
MLHHKRLSRANSDEMPVFLQVVWIPDVVRLVFLVILYFLFLLRGAADKVGEGTVWERAEGVQMRG